LGSGADRREKEYNLYEGKNQRYPRRNNDQDDDRSAVCSQQGKHGCENYSDRDNDG
jgi:hypothetical protein